MRISLIGTRGVPARYGGFETCVEEVGRRLADWGHSVTVYCRNVTDGDTAENAPEEYRGMRLVQLPALRKKTLETLSHTALSVRHAATDRPDAAFVFNSANAPLLPVLRAARIPVATHVDGLEWRRAKWGSVGKKYYRAAEALAVRASDALIADARGIQDYYRARFGVPTDYIPYGATVLRDIGFDRLAELGLRRRAYHLVVARFEPENHVHLAVAGYVRSRAELPLVVVGAAPYADAYTARVTMLAGRDPNVRLLGSVWDQSQLDQLYANALTYVHGHSVGGTNPSLLRAMGAGTATLAFDVNFNREVLGESGHYFADERALAYLYEGAESDVESTVRRGERAVTTLDRYNWDDVARKYLELAERIAGTAEPAAAGVRRMPGRHRRPQRTPVDNRTRGK